MMKKRVLLIAILALLLILAASATLASAGRAAGQTSPTLEGTRWVLVSYKNSQGNVAAALPSAVVDATFAGGKVSGSAGCNNYTAAYQTKGGSLTVGTTASTMMACATPVMDQEKAYLENLQASATFTIEGDKLNIADAKGAVVLSYQASKAGSLTGVTWTMTMYNNGKGGFQSAMSGVAVTALFDQEGKLSGNGGCNSYSAPYSVDGNKIKIDAPVSTRMACEQGVMDQESAYLAALTKAATYKIDGTKLMLRDAGDAAMVEFIQAPGAAGETAPTTGSGAATTTTATPKGDAIYLTLRPAADASVQAVVLSLKADATAKFSRDFGKDKPVVESGTWAESNGAVTVTLTDKDGTKLAAPDIMKFQRQDTFLNLVDFDKAVWGENGLKLNLAGDIVRKARSAMVTLDLSAGFPLDPTFVSVQGGGEVDAKLLNPKCSGYINRQPVATVKWSGDAERVRTFFYSDGDPTLVIMNPKGELFCNDNATENLLDPFVEIAKPVAGDYRIWVGSTAKNQLVPGILVMTTKSDVDLGTFELSKLVKRPAIPQMVTTTDVVTPTAASKIAPQVEALADKLVKAAPGLKPGAAAVTVDVKAEGIIPLFRIPAAANKGCAGLVTGAPTYAFKWSGKTGNLTVAFLGDADSTLMVVGTAGKQVWCNDDVQPGTFNPGITIPSPADDTYLVYVGRVSPKQPVTGKLTVAEGVSQ